MKSRSRLALFAAVGLAACSLLTTSLPNPVDSATRASSPGSLLLSGSALVVPCLILLFPALHAVLDR